jgi:hypothetical protein
MFLGYVRRHHIGLLALFVALGGTSYAAVKLPRNSVGTAQIKNHAVTTSKLSTSTVKALKGAKGEKGATGTTGATGAAGAKGDPGAPATLSAGVSGLSVSSGPATGNDVGQPVTVTLKQAGKILVAMTGGVHANCGGACTFEVGAILDGATPVTGAYTSLTSTADKSVAVAGMVDAAAGTHTLQLRSRATGAVNTSSVDGDTRLIAIAIG